MNIVSKKELTRFFNKKNFLKCLISQPKIGSSKQNILLFYGSISKNARKISDNCIFRQHAASIYGFVRFVSPSKKKFRPLLSKVGG